MNGKQAKKLRRQAEARTVGMPANGYQKQPTIGYNFDLTPILHTRHIWHPSTRAAYKLLKRRYNNAARRIGS